MAFRKSNESNVKCEVIEKYGKLADRGLADLKEQDFTKNEKK